MGKFIDKENQRFGMLTVIKRLPNQLEGKHNTSRIIWLCRCDCGIEIKVKHRNLNCYKKTRIMSCGCYYKSRPKYNFVDLTGKKFGELTILELCPEKTKYSGALWLCKCSCGKLKKLNSNSLTSGNNTTCGCKENHSQNNHIRSTGFKEISGAHIYSIKRGASSRGLEFSLSAEFLWNLFLKQDKKCTLTGETIKFCKKWGNKYSKETTASLDRINSSKGYINENVQWVHKIINIMKQDLTDEEFIEWCNKVSKYNKDKHD